MSKLLPLCVDLDGTLVHSDLLQESFIRLLRQKFLYLFFIPFWLLKGKPYLKHKLAQKVSIDYSCLPYNHRLISYIENERNRGRKIILVTAADKIIAGAIAAQLGLFDEVLASTEDLNLKGRKKAAALLEKYTDKGFDYVGNEKVDLHIWKHAHTALSVNHSRELRRVLSELDNIKYIETDPEKSLFKSTLRALRPHQWAKNILVFIPLLLAHSYFDEPRVLSTLLAFVSFCLCASAVYIFNDLMDLDADRCHPEKKKRPFAAGDLPIFAGLALSIMLLVLSAFLAFTISVDYFFVFVAYFLSTTAYSLGLKSVALLDVFILAGLYTIRVLAGTFAANVELSFWLLAFSLFIFFSLAMLKRYSELYNLEQRAKKRTVVRGYSTDDKEILALLGVASGYISVLVMALYITTPEHIVEYRKPEFLWIVFPALLFWISRIWLLASRGQMSEDPVLFALKDVASYSIALIAATGVVLAI
ncbi:Integral membrane protein [hydrothermal vent metagenome]|uniref:Integral membrane protein n=1 Tax=hydrothermal vent metagenome TaxID=652676 RepID=A0A3B1BN00_9ZZZZ